MSTRSAYPSLPAERDRWILEQRPERNKVDADRPYAFLAETELAHTGEVVSVATILLTNRECPWRCVMCDLWRNTLPGPTPLGAIPTQIEFALAKLPPARHVKLYNSGSFFDRNAIPPQDYGQIASLLNAHERIIVESHPALVGDLVLDFRDLLRGQLEVAMGLETVHPDALEKINKKLTTDHFAAAAHRLRQARIDLRVFVLVQPPFVLPREALFWAKRSLDFAFACGATAVTLIPTRDGNGAMETLSNAGEFVSPHLSVIESAIAYGLELRKGRVFVDLWDIARVPSCPSCRGRRIERLQTLNLSQRLVPNVDCSDCGGES